MPRTLARRLLLQAALTIALPLAATATLAQGAWTPTQPVKLIVPFAPGGGADIMARILSDALGRELGQPVIVENKSGASGSIGSEIVYRAPPDGHTLLIATLDSQGMYPHMRQVGFDSAKYVPVGGIAQMGYALMGRPGMPATLPELRSQLRAKQASYGSGGAGSSLHVLTELFAKETQAKLLHVPYKGAGPALQDLLAGQIDLMMVPLATAPQYRGKLVTYGITSAQRNPAMPDVPTLKEAGLDVVGDSWAALLAPPGTPGPIADRLAATLTKVVALPDVNRRLRETGMTPMTLSRSEFVHYYADEYRKWGEVIKAANITLDN
ncbi:Argininosuccinate lyase [Variovorax sp. PBS-H4]|uniref:Bug family tripartite tricarboxylate transporter substrate binding protein n=1 Tax=Variovorax sp. PBS-H4 TaxID=434008 RepID=UPI0013198C79|nr:tripartite tricarboxylate transporter substrate binding protein [Variovorax sp. PBS-H4]VTU27285.1 Argininosuccinate lyase [Variovorax sp. PBS-H4]